MYVKPASSTISIGRMYVMDAVVWEEDLSQTSLVHFYIAPLPIKIGNADGKHYETHKILARARVVCC